MAATWVLVLTGFLWVPGFESLSDCEAARVVWQRDGVYLTQPPITGVPIYCQQAHDFYNDQAVKTLGMKPN